MITIISASLIKGQKIDNRSPKERIMDFFYRRKFKPTFKVSGEFIVQGTPRILLHEPVQCCGILFKIINIKLNTAQFCTVFVSSVTPMYQWEIDQINNSKNVISKISEVQMFF